MALQPQQGPAPIPTAGGAPAATLSVARDGDTLTASAAVPFSLQVVISRGISVIVSLYFVSFAWRVVSTIGRVPLEAAFPALLLILFAGAAAVTSMWGMAMAISGRVTATFDRSRIGVVQEAFGRIRRTKDYAIASISGLGVSAGRLPRSAARLARFDRMWGQSRPASYMGFHSALRSVIVFPGMPEPALLDLLDQVRSHYAMLGVDIAVADEQPGEADRETEAVKTPETPTRPQAPATPPPMREAPSLSDKPAFDPEAPPR